MKTRLTLLTCAVLVCSASLLRAEERFMDFLDGLREREYYDFAILYLEQLETRPEVPADVKELIPYEKGITSIKDAAASRNPDTQTKKYDLAKGFLEDFLKASPNHEKAAQANTELANVLIGKGKVDVLQSKSPNNVAQKDDFQKKARANIAAARKVFQAAHDQYEAAYKAFPTFIDKKEKQKYEDREKAMVSFIQAQLNLAICTYEEAQTYDTTAPEYRKILTDASLEFEKIHSRYRSQLAGLYARMWQGKCFEEQEDITKALGIYKELLSHGEDKRGAALKRLQDRVLQFRLICLNHEQRKDYTLVMNEAAEWLKENTSIRKSRIALGIRWEKARAAELEAKKEETPKDARDKLLNAALVDAREIVKYPSEYKDPAQEMVKRVMAALNKDTSDPKDFDTAFGLSRDLVSQIKKKTEAIEPAKPEDKPKLQEDYNAHLQETARILRLALALATPKDEVREVNRVRYWLSYVYYLTKTHSYESAILGNFVATRYKELDPEMALDAAYLAMAAYQQSYNSSEEPEEQRLHDVDKMVQICSVITATWPTSDKANDARMLLGRMFEKLKRPEDAAAQYLQVPETATNYNDAQLAAGQAYWQAYLDGVVLPEDKRPAKEKLDDWLAKAQTTLRESINRFEAKLPKEAGPEGHDNISAAKFSLAQILNGSGAYPESLTLLTEGPRSLVIAVAWTDKDKPRPKSGIKGTDFAGAVYQELLRTYVGLQQLDKARTALKDLESIGGSASGGITSILLRLGRELEKEVKRLQAANDARLDSVLKSFETFLDDMFARKEGQDFNSLMWVGETYFALGEGLDLGDKARAEGYFGKAATAFQAVLDEGAKDAKFLPQGAQSSVQMRLVTCKRRQGDFDEAFKIATTVLKERPNALDAQTEAARVYQDWAARGGPEDAKYWNRAINGNRTLKKKEGDPIVWGWFEIAKRLGGQLVQGNANPDYEKQFLDASYNVAYCRFKYGMTQSARPKKDPLIDGAKRDITVTMLTNPLGDSWEKFNKLYREIQQEMVTSAMKGEDGQVVTEVKDLPKTVEVDEAERARLAKEANALEAKTAAAPIAKKPAKKKAESSSGGLWMAILALVFVGAGGGAAFVMNGKKKSRPALASKLTVKEKDVAAVSTKKKVDKPAATKTKS